MVVGVGVRKVSRWRVGTSEQGRTRGVSTAEQGFLCPVSLPVGKGFSLLSFEVPRADSNRYYKRVRREAETKEEQSGNSRR